MSIRNISGLRPLAAFGAVLIAAAVLVITSPSVDRARASICSGDSPAFSMNWRDNYWVGSDNDGSPICDQAGQFIVSVQRINWAHGYRASSVDGYYGPNTQDDVEDFQSGHGLSADGLVGTNTWGKYDDHPQLKICYGSGECEWKYSAYGGNSTLWEQATPFNQVCAAKLGNWSQFVWFDRTGPSGTNNC